MDRKVLRNLSYGMYVIGCKDEKNAGCVVNTVVQITSDPMTIAVSINHDNYTNEVIKKTNKFSVSILDVTTDPKLIGIFGYKSSKDIDKYENINYAEKEGIPYIKKSCGNMLCEVIDTLETSTHTVFLAKIVDAFNYNDKTPMTYKYYHEELKGKSPKNAPTFVEEKEEIIEKKKTKYRCTICGYEIETDTLPEDFVCPICGQPVTAFEKID